MDSFQYEKLETHLINVVATLRTILDEEKKQTNLLQELKKGLEEADTEEEQTTETLEE